MSIQIIETTAAPRFRIVSGSTFGTAFYEVQKRWLKFFWLEKHRIYVEGNDVNTAFEEAKQVMADLTNIEIAYYQQSRSSAKVLDIQGLPCVCCSKPSDTATEDGADMCWPCMAGFACAEYSGLKTRAIELVRLFYPRLSDEEQIAEILDPARPLPAPLAYVVCPDTQELRDLIVDDFKTTGGAEPR